MPFISFSCLIALARNSGTMLNRSGRSENPCLILNLRAKAFNFSLLKMMMDGGFSYVAFISWINFLYSSSVESIYYEKALNFVRCFFTLMRSCDFYPSLGYVGCCINWFLYFESSLYPRGRLHLVIVCDPFNVFEFGLPVYYLGFLHQYSSGYWPIIFIYYDCLALVSVILASKYRYLLL